MNPRRRMAIAAMAAAATFIAGGAATALASQRAPAAAAHRTTATDSPAGSPVTWHSLHLINGWRAVQPSMYGTPAYAISNGVLYLRGIIQAHKGGPLFAVLPAGARPAHFLNIPYPSFGGNTLGILYIQPAGQMIALSLSGGLPPKEPSLTAISFPLST